MHSKFKHEGYFKYMLRQRSVVMNAHMSLCADK